VICPSCSGVTWTRLGRLGARVWFRCRACFFELGLAEEACLALGVPITDEDD
jgi:hypothetical protein